MSQIRLLFRFLTGSIDAPPSLKVINKIIFAGDLRVYCRFLRNAEMLLKLNALSDIIGIGMKKSEFREFDNTL